MTTALPSLDVVILRARHPSHIETDLRRSISSLQASPGPFIPHIHTLHHPLGRSSIRLLHGGTNMVSTNSEAQQFPEQNHDANDGVYIRFYYILYGCQVMKNGATLLPLIQPARVAESPDDVDRLESLP